MLYSFCSKYEDSFSASFEEFSYFLSSPLAGSLFLFKLLSNLGTSPPSSLLECDRNSCYFSNRLHTFCFNNAGAIEYSGIKESQIKITSCALISIELFSKINLEKNEKIFLLFFILRLLISQ